MLAQICFDNEHWPPDIATVLPKVLPVLYIINFEVLEKRAVKVMWGHTESSYLCHVLLCPMEHCQLYNKAAVTWWYLWVVHSLHTG